MTRIAELQDRLRRLAKRREGEGIYTDAAICEEAAEALSRTGAVKVKALVSSLLDLRDLIMRGKRCVTDTGPAVKPVIELAAVHILDDAANALEALSALEPATPEGQQEAARIGDAVLAWMTKYDLLDGEQEYYVADVIAVLDDLTPLTRPSEQAVTDAARRVLKWVEPITGDNRNEADAKEEIDSVAALKAAMEAGRHE